MNLPEIDSIWKLIGALFLGGGLRELFAMVGNYRKNTVSLREQNQKMDIINFNTLLQSINKEKLDLIKIKNSQSDEITALRESLHQLEIEVYLNKTRYKLLESTQMHSPLPMWLSDSAGRMEALNEAYEIFYLKPYGKSREDRLGKTTVEFLQEVDPDLIQIDSGVQEDGSVFNKGDVVIKEKTHSIKGEEKKVKIIKYLRHIGKVKLGIAGISILKKEDLLYINNQINNRS